jgi:hypothetical protein
VQLFGEPDQHRRPSDKYEFVWETAKRMPDPWEESMDQYMREEFPEFAEEFAEQKRKRKQRNPAREQELKRKRHEAARRRREKKAAERANQNGSGCMSVISVAVLLLLGLCVGVGRSLT